MGKKEETMDKVVIITKNGVIKKLDPKTVRETSRAGQGVMGIRLREGDEVVGITTIVEDN
jgi:DNA gyrase subunit A